MLLSSAMFYALASVAVACSFLTIMRRSAAHSSLFFCGALLATAGIFLQLEADFLFAVQVLIFAGGIAVVYFGAGISARRRTSRHTARRGRNIVLAATAAVLLAAELCYSLFAARSAFPGVVSSLSIRNAQSLAALLFQRFLLPFEMLAILLVIAAIAAVIVARERPE